MEVGGQSHIPAALCLGKSPVAIVQEAEWASGPVWMGVENYTSARFRTLNHPVHGVSLAQM
jgi:hypothetical protein